MSNTDVLDLMKFLVLVEIEQLFSKFFNSVKLKHVASYVDQTKRDCFTHRIHCITLERISFYYDLTKIKLNQCGGHESSVWLIKFKLEISSILKCAEAYLMDLLIDDVKFSEESYIEKNMPEVFVIKEDRKEKQNEIMSTSLQNAFWNARLGDLNLRLSRNSKQSVAISLLPIVSCFFEKKKVTMKIGILKEETCCPKIIWIKTDFSTEDKQFRNYVDAMPYHRINNFLLLRDVFEKILQEENHNLLSIEKQKSKISYEEVKYLGMTTSNIDINHFPENIRIKSCPTKNNLYKWLCEQNTHTTIYVLFVMNYHNGLLLGLAEVKNFNQYHLSLSWCLKSLNGVKLISELEISEHLNDQFFVIKNGKQLVEEYEKECTEQDIPSMAELQNNGDEKQEEVGSSVNGFADVSFDDIYLDVLLQPKGKLPIQYFIFISQTSDHYLELVKMIDKNLESFDRNAMNLFFVTNANKSCILSLYKLVYGNGWCLKDLQTISLNLLQKVTDEPKNAGDLHPCERGKELVKLYYECLNPRPAHLWHTTNSCYLVSMLQCLKACFDLKEVEEIYDLLDSSKDICPLSFMFFRLLHMMFSTSHCSIDTTDLREELGKYSQKYNTQSQQDGYEFLMCLIKSIEKELANNGDSHARDSKSVPMDILCRKFVFEIQTTLKCKRGHIDGSTQKDYSVIITPHSPKNGEVDLKCCLEKMFCTEKMKEILCQKCPKEKRVSEGELETSIISLPEILIVYINRWNPRKKSKNENELRFELDDFEVKYKGGTEHYKAVAFCNHLGSLDVGHYKANVRGDKDNVWFICDDVSDKHEALIWDQPYKYSRDVYTIFYRKK